MRWIAARAAFLCLGMAAGCGNGTEPEPEPEPLVVTFDIETTHWSQGADGGVTCRVLFVATAEGGGLGARWLGARVTFDTSEGPQVFEISAQQWLEFWGASTIESGEVQEHAETLQHTEPFLEGWMVRYETPTEVNDSAQATLDCAAP